jgi:hypothetical protein
MYTTWEKLKKCCAIHYISHNVGATIKDVIKRNIIILIIMIKKKKMMIIIIFKKKKKK